MRLECVFRWRLSAIKILLELECTALALCICRTPLAGLVSGALLLDKARPWPSVCKFKEYTFIDFIVTVEWLNKAVYSSISQCTSIFGHDYALNDLKCLKKLCNCKSLEAHPYLVMIIL